MLCIICPQFLANLQYRAKSLLVSRSMPYNDGRRSDCLHKPDTHVCVSVPVQTHPNKLVNDVCCVIFLQHNIEKRNRNICFCCIFPLPIMYLSSCGTVAIMVLGEFSDICGLYYQKLSKLRSEKVAPNFCTFLS